MKQLNLILLYPLLFVFFISCSKDDSEIIHFTDEDVILEYVNYGAHERNKMNVLLPAGRNTSKTKVLVLIHGGGWIAYDKSDFDILLNSENLENLKKNFPT